MSKGPLVSVVMPTYNQAMFVGEAIESVLNQTYNNYELIIIDNYSDDGTEEIVNSYAYQDKRIIYKKFSNKGIIATSRNIAIKMSRGYYIAFLDSDDLWFADKLKKVIEFYMMYPEIDLICNDEYFVQGDDKSIIKRARYGPYRKYRDLLFKGNSLSTSAVTVKKSKLLAAGMFSEDKRFVTAEDYELWLRLSKSCNIAYLHEVLGNWRVHEVSNSGSVDRHTESVSNVINHHFRQWPYKNTYYRLLLNKRRGAVLRGAGRSLLKSGDFISARSYLTRALKRYPFSLKTWILFSASLAQIKL